MIDWTDAIDWTIILLVLALLPLIGFTATSGYGQIVTYQSGFLAKVTGINISGISRKALDVTHCTSPSGKMEFYPSDLVNNGQLEIDLLFDPDRAVPIDQPTETVTLTWPLPPGRTTPANWSGQGFMISASVASPMDDKKTQKVTIQWTGVVTVTPSS